MKIAYLVFAYKNPELLKRLIGRLSDDSCAFFVHIDKKQRIEQFAGIGGNNVLFSETRLPVYWAEFSGVEAILLLTRQALRYRPMTFDYLALLSGSEYPLRSKQYIEAFLKQQRGAEFISLAKMPAPGKPLSRINTVRPESSDPVRRLAMRALAKIGLAQRDYRRFLPNLEPYSGITWWALTNEACEYILEFVAANPHVTSYFRDVFAPEETFFHTILGNSPFRSRIRRNVLYEDWSIPGGHPAMITDRHIDFFEACDEVRIDAIYGPGELLFARKFDDGDTALLSRIDNMIARKEKVT